MLPDLSPRHCSSTGHVLADVARSGVALLIGVSAPSQLLSLADALGTVVPHRDSGPDGVTVIQDRGARASGLAGFSRCGLALQTDRSGVEFPPGLVLTACGNEPSAGGESLLADGLAIYDDLAESNPDALEALCSPRSALFGGADGHLTSVFTMHRGTVSIRLRTDDLARFAPTVTPHLSTLRAAIERHAVALPLRTGEGYVINNHRWLHGRNSFRGNRIFYRVTANPHPGAVPAGFHPTLFCERSA